MSDGSALAAGGPIRFGTSGWRGLGDVEVTEPRVRIAARAAARWFAASDDAGPVVVAHDTRARSGAFAAAAAGVLRAEGIAVVTPAGPVATPVAVHGAVARGARAALVFTASHNPPEYAGLKVFGAAGASLDVEATRGLEALAAECCDPGERPPRAAEERADFTAAYVDDLVAALGGGVEAGGAAGPRVYFDAMHGAGAGPVEAVLARLGCRVETLRGDPRADFGGDAPEPSETRLSTLAAASAADPRGALGVATDGDADRFAVVDERGGFIAETEALALLTDHLAASGRLAGGVAISSATGTLVERVAAAHGLRVERHPIGFKHFAASLASGAVGAAGDESGGFALGEFGIDKDGILAVALFAEMLARGGEPIARRRAVLADRYGHWHCERTAVAASEPVRQVLARLEAAPPDAVADARVREVARSDGLRLAFEDGFLMWRRSGTEPLVRIYAEARDAVGLARRLAAGRALLGPEAGRAGPLDGLRPSG